MSQLDAPANAHSEFRNGWPRLTTAFFSSGLGPIVIINTNGLFVEPITDSTGLPTSQVQIGAVVSLVLSVASIFVGMLIGRIGSKRIVMTGFTGMGASSLLLAALPATPLVFYSVAVLLGLFGAMAFQVPFVRMISTWFRRQFGLAAGIMGAGGASMSLIATPAIVAAIAAGGWRFGYVVLAGLFLLVALPLVFYGFKENDRVDADVSNESAQVVAEAVERPRIGQVLRNGRYWLAILGVALASFALVGFVSSLAPAMSDEGYSRSAAATVPMAYLVGGLLGRVLGGYLLDRLWPYLVPIVLLSIGGFAGLGLGAAIEAEAYPVILTLVLAIGFAAGADADFPAFFSREILGEASLALGVGVMVLAAGLASVCGGLGFAMIRDNQGTYYPAFILGGIAFIVGGLLLFLAGAGTQGLRSSRPVSNIINSEQESKA
ncbi:MFS transporter [Rhodococcus sp. USK13]|uniref:MFS transporter n=1 Tax=Rhodococcus sp. USK13 TaxID=2806442 RepID=UPI001BCF415F|nr:MFS transporter [Rhodococcus sp. USK13]